MGKGLLIFGTLLAVSLVYLMMPSNAPQENLLGEEFQNFMSQYNKVYATQRERNYRFAIFKRRYNEMMQHNSLLGVEWFKGINQFSDLTDEEFVKMYLMEEYVKENPILQQAQDEVTYNHNLGDTDWRNQGAVNGIKNQGRCGSCWAFAAISSAEGWGKIKRGSLPNLSEQQLVDCCKNGNMGCRGGYPNRALQCIATSGSATQSEYPYAGVDQACKKQGGSFKTGGVKTAGASDSGLKSAIDQMPIAVTVDASNWSTYRSGIFSNCGQNINHAVTAVGYTASYWIIRNSWGTSWGMSGYMQLKMGNTCGLHRQPGYYPA